ncbi:MAG: aerotolerance regulator BatA [Planctomyces sp.]|nr:aerotolerance regulator BatA [Planctomyces sp.]
MGFSHPWVLILLILPIVLMIWTWRSKGTRVCMPFDHGIQTRGRGLGFVMKLALSIPAAILFVVVLILAVPQQLSAPKTKRVLTNIEFCVDVSGSMSASFGEGTRYDASMAAIDKFLTYREGDAFGLTFFGNEVLHWVPLTTDVSAIRCAPPFMDPTSPGHPHWLGGTAIGKALRACHETLMSREEGDRMIVLVSDGYSFDLGNGQELEIADQLKKDGIVVYAIHIAESEVPGPIVNIAGLTNGEIFEPEDPEALVTVFEHIDKMQETRLERTAAESMDNFYPYSLAGLVLLGTGTMSLFGLRYTPW